jgi:hypothetical protein
VSDDAAREFAEEFYEQLKGSATLGQAVTAARKKTAARSDDPTWLAYTAYGDPRARIASA